MEADGSQPRHAPPLQFDVTSSLAAFKPPAPSPRQTANDPPPLPPRAGTPGRPFHEGAAAEAPVPPATPGLAERSPSSQFDPFPFLAADAVAPGKPQVATAAKEEKDGGDTAKSLEGPYEKSTEFPPLLPFDVLPTTTDEGPGMGPNGEVLGTHELEQTTDETEEKDSLPATWIAFPTMREETTDDTTEAMQEDQVQHGESSEDQAARERKQGGTPTKQTKLVGEQKTRNKIQ
eukprot:GHVT01073678.1.p1 GENE.GHVT01073678.1~~GHVT01073678.1.p1  ORF type:complete len:269 (-),score=73.29 GHVT01073678.1:231-929(-)